MTILASAIVNVVAFRWVWNRTKPIPRSTTDKCSEHNPKIGPLTDLLTRWHSSYFYYKRSSYKNAIRTWQWTKIFKESISFSKLITFQPLSVQSRVLKCTSKVENDNHWNITTIENRFSTLYNTLKRRNTQITSIPDKHHRLERNLLSCFFQVRRDHLSYAYLDTVVNTWRVRT